MTSTDGVVSQNQQTFWIADTKNGGNVFEIYWGNVSQQLQVGDYVKCIGHLMRFYSTPEMKNPNVTLITSSQPQTINYEPNWVEIKYFPQYGFHSLDMYVVDGNNAVHQLLSILFYPSNGHSIAGLYATTEEYNNIVINPNFDGYYVDGTWYDLNGAAFLLEYVGTNTNSKNEYRIYGFCYLENGNEIDFTYQDIVYPFTATYNNDAWEYSELTLTDNLEPINNVQIEEKTTKILRNGQIFILRGDKTYTLQGQVVK